MAQPDPAGNVPETATRTVSVTDTKIPYLEMLNITSDNANNTRATINDILTITLETNETLAGANITALNGTFQMITENDTVTINLPVPANHPTGNVTFNITARDAQNHTLYVTDANLTSGYVFVDTIKPNLTINGNAGSSSVTLASSSCTAEYVIMELIAVDGQDLVLSYQQRRILM